MNLENVFDDDGLVHLPVSTGCLNDQELRPLNPEALTLNPKLVLIYCINDQDLRQDSLRMTRFANSTS